MTLPKRQQVLANLVQALKDASTMNLLDEMAAFCHPDHINSVCDAVDEMTKAISNASCGSKIAVVNLPYARRHGKTQCTDKAYYHCTYCDAEFFGEEIGFLCLERCSTQEYARCPKCNELNRVDRGLHYDEEFEEVEEVEDEEELEEYYDYED